MNKEIYILMLSTILVLSAIPYSSSLQIPLFAQEEGDGDSGGSDDSGGGDSDSDDSGGGSGDDDSNNDSDSSNENEGSEESNDDEQEQSEQQQGDEVEEQDEAAAETNPRSDREDDEEDDKKKYCAGKGEWKNGRCVTDNDEDKTAHEDAVCDNGSKSKFCKDRDHRDRNHHDNDNDDDDKKKIIKKYYKDDDDEKNYYYYGPNSYEMMQFSTQEKIEFCQYLQNIDVIKQGVDCMQYVFN
jgi:hypothetical protein